MNLYYILVYAPRLLKAWIGFTWTLCGWQFSNKRFQGRFMLGNITVLSLLDELVRRVYRLESPPRWQQKIAEQGLHATMFAQVNLYTTYSSFRTP